MGAWTTDKNGHTTPYYGEISRNKPHPPGIVLQMMNSVSYDCGTWIILVVMVSFWCLLFSIW
jgi:hypothetical protein